MPKFRIICSTSMSYELVVEAPSAEAARRYYHGCDGSLFRSGQDNNWQLEEIYEVPRPGSPDADVVLDKDGEEINKEKDNG